MKLRELGLMVLVMCLRLYGMGDRSITQDESTMVLFAKGVLERGYPFLSQVHGDFVMSTYELVPFPIALSMALLGASEFSVRVPAAIFSAVTSVLILRFGEKLFDRRVAALAALLYAFLPWAIYWGSNAFYPAQVQCFSLMATMLVFRLFEEERPKTWVYYACLATFTLSYLSWEGSGFLLPVFFVILLVLRWGRFQWLGSVHAWIVASLMVLLVVGQLTYRTVLREPYLGIVNGRSEISFAKLAFTGVGYDPLFYFNGLASEAHILLALCLSLGLLWVFGSRALRFLYLFFGLSILFLTSFLGYYALRYVYLTLPALLIAAAAVSMLVVDKLTERSQGLSRSRLWAGSLVATLHLLVASPWGLRPFEVSQALTETSRPYELRQDLGGFPFRSIALALEQLAKPGDVVVVQAPFPLELYAGSSGHYFLQTLPATSTFYSQQGLPYYTDKWVANPVLRSADQLREVLLNHERVWFVSTPDGASRQSVGPEPYAELERMLELVVEESDGRLFLWERPRAGLPNRSLAEARPRRSGDAAWQTASASGKGRRVADSRGALLGSSTPQEPAQLSRADSPRHEN